MKTITSNFELDRIPTSSEWPSFEVLVNPRRLNLGTGHVALRQKGQCSKHNGLIPAKPVLAESPSSQSSTRKKRYLLSSYLAFCEKLRDTHNHHSYWPGVVQEVTENGTLAFFHGLYNIFYFYHPGVVQEIGENGTLVFHYGLNNVKLGLCAV